MKQLFLFSLLLISVSCGRLRPMHSLFRWETISPESDSVVVQLERAFIEMEAADSILPLITSLDLAARHGEKGAASSALFWRARLYNREHRSALEVKPMLLRALALNDSVRRPYTHSRIKYLLAIISRLRPVDFHRELKRHEEFYAKTADPFMTATVSVDLGHIMGQCGDERRCLEYYNKGDSLYGALGIHTYHLKTSLNNAYIRLEMGDTLSARKILSRLLKNRKAQADSDFYINVLTVAYTATADSSLLLTARRLYDKRGVSLLKNGEMELLLARYYLERGELVKARDLCRVVEEKMRASRDNFCHVNEMLLKAQVAQKMGELDTALNAYGSYVSMRDSLDSERGAVEINNAESRIEIARSEVELESRHRIERMWIWLIVMAVLLIAMGVAFLLMRKIQASKLAIARYNLDLERERRSLVSSALVMEEKDNVLESVLQEVHKMEKEGRLKGEGFRRLEQNVKMHLSGRQDWEHFRELFDTVHPQFHKRLKANYPELTEGDLRLATYIKVGMQGKQIARMLMLQPDTIRKNRQKLRRHLHLPPDASLEDLLRNIDS